MLKKTWQILRKAINNSCKKENSIQNIIINNECISDPLIMANKFNEFFSQIAHEIVDKINPSQDIAIPNPKIVNELFSLSDSPVTTQEIVLKCLRISHL